MQTERWSDYGKKMFIQKNRIPVFLLCDCGIHHSTSVGSEYGCRGCNGICSADDLFIHTADRTYPLRNSRKKESDCGSRDDNSDDAHRSFSALHYLRHIRSCALPCDFTHPLRNRNFNRTFGKQKEIKTKRTLQKCKVRSSF